VQWVLTTVGALVVGLVTNVVYDVVKYGAVRWPAVLMDRRSLPPAARAYDSATDGLYPFVTWSRERRLTPETLRTSYVGQLRRGHVLVGDAWDEGVRRFEASGDRGRTAYIAGLEVDTGEHPAARDLRVVIAESRYAQCLAAKTLVSADSAAQDRVLDAVRQGSHHFVTVAPPTMVSVCVAVLSAENRMLTLRRSLAVRTYPGQWTVGINESMKYSDEPGREEDFFALVRRGLQEELGLGVDNYGKIAISWLGWSGDAACYVLVATVRSTLRSAQIDELRAQCHSVYEHDLAAWLPMTRSRIARIIGSSGSGPDAAQQWSYLAPLVATELWRSRHTV